MVKLRCPTCGNRFSGDATQGNLRCPGCSLLFSPVGNTYEDKDLASGSDPVGPKSPEQSSAWMLAGVAVLVLIGILVGLSNGSRRNSDIDALDVRSPVEDRAIQPDPRDQRWDNQSGRAAVRAMARDSGVSEEEMRRQLNDAIDRAGMADWADQ